MVNKYTYFVENMCKTICKTLRKFYVKLCRKNLFFKKSVQIQSFSQNYPIFSTNLLTTLLPLILTYIFHYSTYSITTTINN